MDAFDLYNNSTVLLSGYPFRRVLDEEEVRNTLQITSWPPSLNCLWRYPDTVREIILHSVFRKAVA